MNLSSLNIIVDHMELFWKLERDSLSVQMRIPKNGTICPRSRLIALHLNGYLNLCDSSRFTTHRVESALALHKWSNMTNFWKLINNSPFSHLSEQEISSFFLGTGVCAGATIYHFYKFFQHLSPLESIYPIRDNLEVRVGEQKIAEFHPFHLEKESLNQPSSPIRFLQASYKVVKTDCKRRVYFSGKILKRYDLKLCKRIPEVKKFFGIEEVIPKLKEYSHQNKAYILGIRSQCQSHALAVYPSAPFHFVDSMYGVGTAENIENLLLFLANYLTEKYPHYQKFALLEFESLLPR